MRPGTSKPPRRRVVAAGTGAALWGRGGGGLRCRGDRPAIASRAGGCRDRDSRRADQYSRAMRRKRLAMISTRTSRCGWRKLACRRRARPRIAARHSRGAADEGGAPPAGPGTRWVRALGTQGSWGGQRHPGTGDDVQSATEAHHQLLELGEKPGVGGLRDPHDHFGALPRRPSSRIARIGATPSPADEQDRRAVGPVGREGAVGPSSHTRVPTRMRPKSRASSPTSK